MVVIRLSCIVTPALTVCALRTIEKLSTICAAFGPHLKIALLDEYPISEKPAGVMEGAAQVNGIGESPSIPNSWIQLRLKASGEWRSRRKPTKPIIASLAIVGLKLGT